MATSEVKRPRFGWVVLGAIALLAPGCTRVDNALASVPIFSFLREAPSFDPYEHPLPPPPGAVPFESPNGEVLPPMDASEVSLQAFASSAEGQNPLAPDDPAALALGQTMYERHCAVCHGATGAADGPLVGPRKFPVGFVLPLNSGNSLTLSDGYMYAVIRAGRGRMPAYGPRMTHIERWAVVTYVNRLQAAAGTTQAQTGAAAPAPAPPPPPQ